MPDKPSSSAALIRYDAMCRAIDAAYEVDEVKDIRDKALAWEMYSRLAKNPEPEVRACEIRLRAERKAGQLLKNMEKAKGQTGPGRGKAGSAAGPAFNDAPTLSDLGISKGQSSRWQQLADVPDDQFEAAFAGPDKPSTTGIINGAKSDHVAPMDRRALWVWGRLKDFERDDVLDTDPQEMWDEMTRPMQRDVRRLLPLVVKWLEGLKQ